MDSRASRVALHSQSAADKRVPEMSIWFRSQNKRKDGLVTVTMWHIGICTSGRWSVGVKSTGGTVRLGQSRGNHANKIKRKAEEKHTSQLNVHDCKAGRLHQYEIGQNAKGRMDALWRGQQDASGLTPSCHVARVWGRIGAHLSPCRQCPGRHT